MTWDNFFGNSFSKTKSILAYNKEWIRLVRVFVVSASAGGTFGLCLGASIISFIEIIYFVVVRIIGPILISARANGQTDANETKFKQQTDKKRFIARNHRANHIILQQYIP